MVAVMPQKTPSSVKPIPAAPQLQCSSPTIAGSTTPKELKGGGGDEEENHAHQASVTQARTRRRSSSLPAFQRALHVGGKIAQHLAHHLRARGPHCGWRWRRPGRDVRSRRGMLSVGEGPRMALSQKRAVW